MDEEDRENGIFMELEPGDVGPDDAQDEFVYNHEYEVLF